MIQEDSRKAPAIVVLTDRISKSIFYGLRLLMLGETQLNLQYICERETYYKWSLNCKSSFLIF